PRRLVAGFIAFFIILFSSSSQANFQEAYRLKIENKINGEIAVSQDSGRTWQAQGKVLYPTKMVSQQGYMASAWVESGEVAATAVNAIHIKVSAKGTKTIFSLLPKEFLRPPKKYNSFLSPDSSIYTNIAAGTKIFGGDFAPFVGSQVLVERGVESPLPLSEDFQPKIGDVYYVIVKEPLEYPSEIIFENKFGGRIIARYQYGMPDKVIGTVLAPVVGIGRFSGTNFAGPGRVRANHAGVIDISTSRLGEIGGFQIIPAVHSIDMPYVKRKTQWMVVGAPSLEGETLEGAAPLFKYFINPDYREADIYAEDWEQKFLSRFLVDVKFEKSNDWSPMPILEIPRFYLYKELPTWADTALDKISYIRVLFPL
ncbi:MAG: hypothetical protein KJ811_00265, partial [Candidatus Margulisbacteria bacterium]|nr:hypothetical protein [Candidatus Margulisiibacteriota bacterium]